MPNAVRISLVAAALLLGAASTAPDQLVTAEGRVLDVPKAREDGEGGYLLEFEHGTIRCSAEHVASVAVEGDMSDYVPANDDEREKLEMGYVRYRGRWMSRPAYEAELNKLNEERRKRTEERAKHSDWMNAWAKETKHFVIRTNTSPELLDRYAELLETFYSLMDRRVGIRPTPTLRRTKMTVNIYKNQREFMEISPISVSPTVLGYFYSVDQTLNFFHDYQEPARSEYVALHECTHLLTYLIEPQFRPQIWINEAVADYFGSADVREDSRGRIEIVPGKLQTDRVLTVQQAIEDGKDTKLEDLFQLERGEFDGFQYAHAWSFVYFLNESNSKYQRGFKRFFSDLYTLKNVAKTADWNFADKTGTAFVVEPDEIRRLLLDMLGVRDPEKLEEEWKSFIAAIPIDAPDARFKRAWRTVMYGVGLDQEDAGKRREAMARAREDLDFAISSGFEDPRAYWARARVATVERGMRAAADDLRRAIELSPLTPAYRFDLGQALAGRPFGMSMGSIRIEFEGDMPLDGSPEELAEAREQLGLAMELDPENAFYAESFETFEELYRAHRRDG